MEVLLVGKRRGQMSEGPSGLRGTCPGELSAADGSGLPSYM